MRLLSLLSNLAWKARLCERRAWRSASAYGLLAGAAENKTRSNMNFFSIWAAELILILILLFVVAGPKRMIQWSYYLGRYGAVPPHG